MIRDPWPLTPQRWRYVVSRPENTLIRLLEHEQIARLDLPGLSLDVGGGAATSYAPLLRAQRLHSVNLDISLRPTYVADFNAELPVRGGSYDNVLSFNTLEHVWDERRLLRSIHRVLKPGGRLFLTAPFLYQVHASPSDYHRHTAEGWALLLQECGFRASSIVIEPLAFGSLGAGLSLLEFFLPKKVRMLVRALAYGLALVRDRLKPAHMARSASHVPVGYIVQACR